MLVFKVELKNYLMKDLYRDVKDIFGKANSQRQFYTVRSKSQMTSSFAQWCMEHILHAKKDRISCLSDMGNSGGGTGQSN